MSAGPSNATALIKIDDGEIARSQFDECRYPLNYRSTIGAERAPRFYGLRVRLLAILFIQEFAARSFGKTDQRTDDRHILQMNPSSIDREKHKTK